MTKKQYIDDKALDDLEAALAEDLLDPSTPVDVVEQYLRDAGGNPDKIRTEGVALVHELLEQRRLAWQRKARQRIARRAPLLERVAQLSAMTKEQLVDRLRDLRGDPQLGAPVAAAFRKRQPEESTPEELRSLLEEIETLRAIEADECDGKDDDQ